MKHKLLFVKHDSNYNQNAVTLSIHAIIMIHTKQNGKFDKNPTPPHALTEYKHTHTQSKPTNTNKKIGKQTNDENSEKQTHTQK